MKRLNEFLEQKKGILTEMEAASIKGGMYYNQTPCGNHSTYTGPSNPSHIDTVDQYGDILSYNDGMTGEMYGDAWNLYNIGVAMITPQGDGNAKLLVDRG
jgi:hypothetical protein